MTFEARHRSLAAARELDSRDPLSPLRSEFELPGDALYFAGHSLGPMPKRARAHVEEELEAWRSLGVRGHFEGRHPWYPCHEGVAPGLARLVGAKESEVVAMNALTVNLHLMLVSFYRPRKNRRKILIENSAFPSDRYALESQVRLRGLDPAETVVELRPPPGRAWVPDGDVLGQMEELGRDLALVFLGQCNYLSGQAFDTEAVVRQAHRQGAVAGFNLAHGAGNLPLRLHDWGADFAVWCSYKYLNSGPGGIAGAFVHEDHHQNGRPRLEGWWGQDKGTRFDMGPVFDPIPTAEAWQLSNPPVLQMAALRGSLEVFDLAGGMAALSERAERLGAYLEWLLGDGVEVRSPPAPGRGAMLSLRPVRGDPRALERALVERGALLDFRVPDVLRATPAPLYGSHEDVFRLAEIINGAL